LATRIPSRRSRGSSRSSIIGGAKPRRFHCEGGIEEKAAYAFLAAPLVADVWEQPAAVEYLDELGQRRRHTFDFLVLLKDGTRIAVEVKPSAFEKKWRPIIEMIARQMSRKFADTVLLLTEEKLRPGLIHNAMLIHAVRRDPPRGYDEQIRDLVQTLNGSAKIGDLVAHSGLEGNAFRAIVRLIANGELNVHGNGRIGYGTNVSRPKAGVDGGRQ
jgi:hypothetical protein